MGAIPVAKISTYLAPNEIRLFINLAHVSCAVQMAHATTKPETAVEIYVGSTKLDHKLIGPEAERFLQEFAEVGAAS
jgi:hypothetical protein